MYEHEQKPAPAQLLKAAPPCYLLQPLPSEISQLEGLCRTRPAVNHPGSLSPLGPVHPQPGSTSRHLMFLMSTEETSSCGPVTQRGWSIRMTLACPLSVVKHILCSVIRRSKGSNGYGGLSLSLIWLPQWADLLQLRT